MPDQLPVPFLSEFFEPRAGGRPNVLGTETFTKTNESGDTDAAADGRRAGHVTAAALGTETLTEVRTEGGDADEPRHSQAAVLGTQTATATQEQPDDDRAVTGRSALLGTETFTRMQEGNDTDASGANSFLPLFGARVL